MRTLFGAGLGRNRHPGEQSETLPARGLAYTTERETTGERSRGCGVRGSLNADIFRFNTPKLDLDTALTAFRSFDTGRLRGEFDLSLRYEIIKDFTWNLTFYDSYTSEPPSARKPSGTITGRDLVRLFLLRGARVGPRGPTRRRVVHPAIRDHLGSPLIPPTASFSARLSRTRR